MNIGIVTTWFERGAAYVSHQFEEIISTKHNVYIYARGGESYARNDPKWNKENVTWGKQINSPFVSTVIHRGNFENWIKKNEIELVIFNEQHWFQPLIWCKELGIKTVAYIDYYTEQTIELFDIYDALICNTHRHIQAFSNHKKAFYIPWGTDVELFSPKTKGLVNHKIVTLFHSAGMSGNRKGTDLFILALNKIADLNFKAIIHTQRDLMLQFPELQSVIKELESKGKLEIINKTVTAPGLYHLGDVYVYPSRLEGIGLTIAESISCGLACIVPNNGPMNEFVNESFGSCVKIERYYSRADGYYWPKCEVYIDSLACILENYIDNPEGVTDKKNSARLYALESLSYKKNFLKLFNLIEQVKFNPAGKNLINAINNYDNLGLKRLQKYYLAFKLYKFQRK